VLFNSFVAVNPLTPNDHYSGRTASLTSKRCILYIYSTNTATEYFKYVINSPFFSLQNAVCFVILTYLVPVLLTFYIQSVLKLKKKNNSGVQRLSSAWTAITKLLQQYVLHITRPLRHDKYTHHESAQIYTKEKTVKKQPK